MRCEIVSPWDNFRGLSYGHWLALWNNWLLSENPDKYDGRQMLFLRGNLDYKPAAQGISYPRFIDPNGIYDRTNEKGVRIFEHTAIFIPVITSCYTMGTFIDGKLLSTEEEVRCHVNADIEQGREMWATIMKKGDKKSTRIVSDLKDFLVESPLFKLVVPENSLLNKKQYMPEERPGIYDAVSCAYCIILKSLPPSSYRIVFGGKGRGSYYTNSVYDLVVESKKNTDTVVDISNSRIKIHKKYAKVMKQSNVRGLLTKRWNLL